jgi:hypothetical protein
VEDKVEAAADGAGVALPHGQEAVVLVEAFLRADAGGGDSDPGADVGEVQRAVASGVDETFENGGLLEVGALNLFERVPGFVVARDVSGFQDEVESEACGEPGVCRGADVSVGEVFDLAD